MIPSRLPPLVAQFSRLLLDSSRVGRLTYEEYNRAIGSIPTPLELIERISEMRERIWQLGGYLAIKCEETATLMSAILKIAYGGV